MQLLENLYLGGGGGGGGGGGHGQILNNNVSSLLYSYGRDIYVEYNIQCGEGRMAFLSIREMNLEPKNCQNFNDRLE